MRKKLYRLMAVAAAAAVLLYALLMLGNYRDKIENNRIQQEMMESIGLEPLPPTPASPAAPEQPKLPEELPEGPEASPLLSDPAAQALASADLSSLAEINSEVIGWIAVGGTDISYPLLQHSDNEYYLNHTIEKKSNTAGCIFMEATCSADFSDFNTIIYGHNLKNHKMFSDLKNYSDQQFADEHPLIYVSDGQQIRCYRVFSCYEAPLNAPVYYVQYTGREDIQQKVAASAKESSLIESDLVPTAKDKLLTLSTCTGNGHSRRHVVQAVLIETALISDFD